MGAVAGSVLRAIPLEAAEYAQHIIETERATSTGYAAKYFPPQEYKTLRMLCEAIIPADADSGGAIEAGAPEFIDLLTSENTDYQLKLGGGLMWLDSACQDRYDKVFLDCTTQEQKEILDLIAALAYKNAKNTFTLPGLGKLVLVNRKARMGRNPATGEAIKIKASKKVAFRAAKDLKEAI